MKKAYFYRFLSISTLATLSLGVIFSNKQALRVNAGIVGDYGDAVRMPSMTIYGDPATQMGFCWTTSNLTATNLQILEKSVYDSYGSFEAASAKIKYYDGTIEPSKISGDGLIHRVNAKNLTPNTEYVYRFGDEDLDAWCKIGKFKTAVKSNKNFTFMHISDPQGDNELHYQSYNQLLNDSTSMFNPEWIALTGDITDDSHFGKSIDLHEWELALTSQWDIFKNYPVATVSGNHDGAVNAFHSRYNFRFVEGSDTTTGEYYSFDYQGVHFTCLNSNDTPNPKDPNTTGISDAQLSWCEQDLKAHQNDKFLIVMMHKGLFDSGGHSCNEDGSDYDIEKMRRQLAPMFTKYGVDLVLEGHHHLYNLSYPMVADEYVGQSSYYRIDDSYSYSYRDFGDYKNVYTFSNLKGTFYFNTGTASGQKYYAPVIGGAMEDTIFDTFNPNQKMFTMIDINDNSILLRTYTCTSTETKLFKVYAIAKDSEGTPTHQGGEHDTNFEIEGDYSFTYKFARYNHSADVVMNSKKLVTAEADLAGKFTGTFTSDGGNGVSTCKLYKTGKVEMNSELVLSSETVNFITSGTWYMNENKELIIQIKDEKDSLVTYKATLARAENKEEPKKKHTGIIIATSAVGSLLVIGGGVFLVIRIKKSKKIKNEA